MKRLLCILIAAAAAFMLTACGSAAPEADGDTVQTAETEYGFQVVTEVISEEVKADDGTVLLNGSYELPRLTLTATLDGEEVELVESEADAQKLAVRDAFNAEMEKYRQTVLSFFREISGWAKDLYEVSLADGFAWHSAFADEVKVEKTYQTPGGLLSIYATGYSYTGGAHPNSSFKTWNFDLNTGEFIGYEDIAADEDEFRAAVVANILEQICEQGLSEYYYDDYDSYVRDLAYASVYFDESGMTVLFEEYTMGPHSAGIPTFTVPYEYFIHLLNERGETLILPYLPQETLVLADFYEAQELWSYFDLVTMPLDYEKSAEVDGYVYNRVNYREISTMAELRALLLTRFDEPVVDDLLAPDENGFAHYRDIDGVLYGVDAARGSDLTRGEATYAVELDADGNAGKVIATVEEYAGEPTLNEETGRYEQTAAGYVTVEFPFVQTENGARFTHFESIR